MSLGGGRSLTLEKAVNKAVEAGVHFAVAAGNDNEDACNYSPAAAEGPITVGASTNKDTMAFFSNHGSCVDIFAPGLDIKSTWIGGKNAVNTISGTSMASPHVAGVLALHLGQQQYTPDELKKLLKKQATRDTLAGLPDTTENLLLSIEPLLEEL
jgi:cerevisin